MRPLLITEVIIHCFCSGGWVAYNSHMNFGRKALLLLITPLFSLLLFATALDFGILHLAGGPTTVEKVLEDSGIYKNVIPHSLDNIKQTSGSGGQVSLSDPIVKNAANQALSPQVIQQSANQIIDGVYHWLDGRTTLPDFQVDLSGAKTTFATSVGKGAEQKAASLPVCPTGLSGLPDSFDAFSATCLPAGLTPAQAGANARDTILNGKDFLANPVITAASLKKTNSDQSVFADKQNLPKQFQRIKKTPIILAAVTILISGLIILLSSTRLGGLRKVGITLVVAGLAMLVFAWVLNWVVGTKLLPKLNINNAALAGDIKTLIRDVVQAVDKNYWYFGSLYAGLGLVAIGGTMLISRKSPKFKVARTGNTQTQLAESQSVPEPTAQSQPASPAQPAAPAKRVPKKQIKIQ